VSKHNNVNPGQYKVAGRERPGNAVAKSPKDPDSNRDAQERWDKREERQHAEKEESEQAPEE
jgi:hypothetical protein